MLNLSRHLGALYSALYTAFARYVCCPTAFLPVCCVYNKCCLCIIHWTLGQCLPNPFNPAAESSYTWHPRDLFFSVHWLRLTRQMDSNMEFFFKQRHMLVPIKFILWQARTKWYTIVYQLVRTILMSYHSSILGHGTNRLLYSEE